MKRFKEKTVIVTGAGSDIRSATAIRFAQEGANVVLVGRTTETLKEAVKKFPQDHTWIHTDNYLTIACDVSVPSQVPEMIKAVVDKFERIDVLVNNAGKATQDDFMQLSAEEWQPAIDGNLHNMLHLCQAVLPYLIQAEGNIINVSALSSINSDWNMATYEAGVRNLTRTLAADNRHNGVRINAVNPSVIEDHPAETEKSLIRSALSRPATSQNIAAAITFLASDDAAMITGVNLPVDGGVSAIDGFPSGGLTSS